MIIKIILLICIIMIAMLAYIINLEIVFLRKYSVSSAKIPKSFNNFKVLHISDWHCTFYGKNNKRLINKINNTAADIIVITGDLVERKKLNINKALEFVKAINNRPIYFTYGNHELAIPLEELWEFRNALERMGVIVLENENCYLQKDTGKIHLYGIRYNSDERIDGERISKQITDEYVEMINSGLGQIDKKEFNVLLSHDPLLISAYTKIGFDLVFSGHIHGGGIRFGKYGFAKNGNKFFITNIVSGLVKRRDTIMVVSRGVGNSSIKIRVNNPPEIGVITLKSEL